MLENFDFKMAPTHVAGLAAVYLEGEKSFGCKGCIVVGVVHALFSVEPNLDVTIFTNDADFVPVVPFHDLLALSGEGILLGFLGIGAFRVQRRRLEPSTASFIVETSSPGAAFAIIVLALVAVNPSVGAFFLQSAEHHSRIAAEVIEFHLEAKIVVFVGFFGAQKGIIADVFSSADDAFAFRFEFAIAVDYFPATEVIAVV